MDEIVGVKTKPPTALSRHMLDNVQINVVSKRRANNVSTVRQKLYPDYI